MRFEDWKLLFETERRILARRLSQLATAPDAYQRPSAPPPCASRHAAATQGHGRARASSKLVGARAEKTLPTRSSAEEFDAEPVVFGPVAVSIAVHLVLLIIVLPLIPTEEGRARGGQPRTMTVDLVRWQLARKPEATPAVPPTLPAPASEPTVAAKVEPSHVAPDPSNHSAPEAAAKAPKNPLIEPLEPVNEAPAPTSLGLGAGVPLGAGDGTGHGIHGTRGSGRAAALERFGGGSATEWAVSEGLAWLARHQDRNGSWDPAGFSRHCESGPHCTGPGFAEFRTGLTALALLAFLGAGADGVGADPHDECVRKGLAFLLVTQDDAGCFGREGSKYMYNHAIAAFCMAEAYELTGEERFADAARLGLAFSAAAQQPGGGWDYRELRTMRNDLSVTGWQIMAMHAAREAGIFFDPRMEESARSYLRSTVQPDGFAIYADSGVGEGRQGVAMAAVGLLGRLYLGWPADAPELEHTAVRMLRHPPSWESASHWERHFQSTYYWYYATLSLFHLGGDTWEAWNVLIQRELLPRQVRSGERRGSWDPDPNWVGAEGGRIASTALNVLTFEVYYRYTPLHLQDGAGGRAHPGPSTK